MPLEISSVINSLVDSVCNSKLTNAIVSNPFLVALLLVSLIVSIILGIFYDSIKKESWTSFIKAYIYGFIAAVIILLLHYRCQEREIEKLYVSEQGRTIFQEVQEQKLEKKIGGVEDTDIPEIGGRDVIPDPAINKPPVQEKKVDGGCGCGNNKTQAGPQLSSQQITQPANPLQKTELASLSDKSKVIKGPSTKSPYSK